MNRKRRGAGLLKILLVVLFLGGALVFFFQKLAEQDKTPEKSTGILYDAKAKTVRACVDQKTFILWSRSILGYSFATEKPDSREDARQRRSSVKSVTLARDLKLVLQAHDKKTIVDLPVGTTCRVIKALRFDIEWPRSSQRRKVTGMQIAVTEGEHKGFEGWIFPANFKRDQ